MNKVRSYVAYGIKKIWTLFALLLVISAVAISLLRFSLPYLDRNKHLVEDYISQNYNADLTIGSISAEWTKHGPSLVLNDVNLLDAGSQALELTVGRVYVEVNFWQSMQTFSLQSKQFELNQARMMVNTHLLPEAKTTDENIIDVVSNLFLERLQQFSISDSSLTINTEANSQTYALRNVTWLNQGDRHQAVGQMRVAELTRNSALFVLDLHGEASALRGKLYAKGDDVDLSPWFNELTNEQQTLLESRGNFSLWVNIEDGRPSSAQIELAPSLFQWQSLDNTVFTTSIERGRINAKPHAGGWLFNVNELVLSANGQSMTSSFAGRVHPSGYLHLQALSDIELAPFMEFMPLIMNQQQADMLSGLSLTGQLTDFQLQSRNQGISISADLERLAWQSSGALPGLDNLEANFVWYKNNGRLAVATANAQLDTQNVLDTALDIEAFSADIYVYSDSDTQSDETRWFVHSDNIRFESDKVGFTQQLSYQIDNQHLLLAMQVSALPVAQVPALFSERYMGKDTKAYLTRALVDQDAAKNASVNEAKLIWQGALGDFPFEQQNGVFQAGVNISDANFIFSSEWPMLTDLNIELLFENDSLTMRSPTSRLKDVELRDMVATIASLSDAKNLQISASASANGQQLAELMMDSQMADSLGALFSKELLLQGELNSELALAIPLEGDEVKASGVVSLNQSDVLIPSLDLALTQANGEVTFVNAEVSADQLNAHLFGQPVKVDLQGQQLDIGYQSDIQVAGDWSLDQVVSDYYAPLQSTAAGQGQFNADLSLVTLSAGGFEYQLDLDGDLSAAQLSLPEPFINSPITAFTAQASGNQQASVIKVSTDNQVFFDGVLPHKELKFSRAHLAIGGESVGNLGVGFSIAADVPIVDVNQWSTLINDLVAQSDTQQHSIIGVPERLFISAEQMLVGGQNLENATVQARLKDNDWSIDVVSKQAQAALFIDSDWYERGITVDAEFMRLKLSDYAGSEANQVTQLPPIRLRCEQCQIGRFDLGNVALDGTPSENGYTFEQVVFNNGNGLLRATGEWQSGPQDFTRFEGEVTSSDFGQLLKSAGFDSGIKDSEAEISFELSWADAPWKPDPELLDGNIDWELTDGYITELSDKGSRIFTLFSLNSLVRKLSLDFRDVFAQGFFYDDIAGSIQIANGKADTQDTIVDGGAGEITINGYSDLVSNQLNYQVSFTPNVTGNLPILMYFMVNPPTALAALALDQMLTSAKVISNVNYSVTGTFDEPIVNELGRDSTEVSLPARVAPEGEDDSVDDPEFEPPAPVSVRTQKDGRG